MNLSISTGQMVTNELYKGELDFDQDTFRAILVRSGWSFNASAHLYLRNLKAATSGAATHVALNASTKVFTRSDAGSFLTDGFVMGNRIVCSGTDAAGSAPGAFRVTSVTSKALRVASLESPLATLVSGTDLDIEFTADDELEDDVTASNGYDRGTPVNPTFAISGSTLTLNPFDLSVFGPSPLSDFTQGAILYDDTNTNKVIIAYLKFSPWTMSF